MRLNERWIWVDDGDSLSSIDAGIGIFCVHPGAWILSLGGEALGPFPYETILRAFRVARGTCMDGCELGPGKSAFSEISGTRRPFFREPKWRAVSESELPPSLTVYDASVSEPVKGCCTTFSDLPKLGAEVELGEASLRALGPMRALAARWNAHPVGSVIAVSDPPNAFSIVDLP